MGRRAGRGGLPAWLHARQLQGSEVGEEFAASCGMTGGMVARLGLCRELEGHTGCVNCIQWSPGGRLLASGSDDKAVIVWDGLAAKKLARIETPHEGNIFSVVWLPGEDRGLLASGAGDHRLCLLDLPSGAVTRVVKGHRGRLKRLAVAGDSPGLLWSGAEDGTVRQWDLREKWVDGADGNILVNLATQVGRGSEVKCLSICPHRTELVAIGSNDPYVRLYDRRMVQPSSSPTGGAVSYLVPGHLPGTEGQFQKKLRPLSSTYVTFSADGSELLANLGGEQLYLYDRFVLHQVAASPPLSAALSPHLSAPPTNGHRAPPSPTTLAPAVEAAKLEANREFEAQHYSRAVELYNTCLARHGAPHPILLANRAAALMKRRWDGDLYAALRDCLAALSLEPGHVKAHLRLARCLADLGWLVEARQALQAFQERHPESRQASACTSLEQELEARGEQGEAVGRRAGLPRGLDSYTATSFLRSSNESEELDSDDDSEMDMETVEEEEEGKGEVEERLRREARDYTCRFLGACNTTTDIKEANFLGQAGSFVMAGSDDGRFFIWDRRTGNIVRVLAGDESIVNCLQAHPATPLLATSGIDPVVRLWEPGPEDGVTNSREVADREAAADSNQQRMNADPFELILRNIGGRGGLAEGAGEAGEGAVQCAPS